MKKILMTFSFVVFLFLLPFCFSNTYAASPTLTIIKPQTGDVLNGFVVSVEFGVKNFVLKDYRTVTKPVSGQGHIKLWLDDAPTDVGKVARRWSKDTPYVFADVNPGDHTLTVTLVGNDGLPLNPPVTQTVNFKTQDPTGAVTSGKVKDLSTSTINSSGDSKSSSVSSKSDFISTNKVPLAVGLVSLVLGLLSFLFLRK